MITIELLTEGPGDPRPQHEAARRIGRDLRSRLGDPNEAPLPPAIEMLLDRLDRAAAERRWTAGAKTERWPN